LKQKIHIITKLKGNESVCLSEKVLKEMLERNRKNNLIASVLILITGLGIVIAGIILEFFYDVMIPNFGLYLLIPGIFAVIIAIISFLRTRSLKVKIENM